MNQENDSLIMRVENSFQQLSAAATTLNSASDELGKSITHIEALLKRLNLGVSAWVTVDSDAGEDGSYSSREIGYAKVDGKWGIALKTVSGHQAQEYDHVETWLFNDAPRWLRIAAVEKLADLLEKLTTEAASTRNEILSKTAYAQSFATALSLAVEQTAKRK